MRAFIVIDIAIDICIDIDNVDDVNVIVTLYGGVQCGPAAAQSLTLALPN